MYGRYFLWALIHFEIAGIVSTHFIYISELNDYECNDGTTIMISSIIDACFGKSDNLETY